jgi:hypothetical protein
LEPRPFAAARFITDVISLADFSANRPAAFRTAKSPHHPSSAPFRNGKCTKHRTPFQVFIRVQAQEMFLQTLRKKKQK